MVRYTLVVLAALSVIASGLGLLYRLKFPYGHSHCCDLCLGSALQDYAADHEGHFPSGGKTPEASLSLLYPKYAALELLRGKTVSVRAVKQALEKDGYLGPETCGWHYVEGLTLSDDPNLGLVWDKAGLGHHGETLPEGGHLVIFVNGQRQYIPGAEWPGFMEDQKKLLASRDPAARSGTPLMVARVRLPSGEIVDHVDGISFELEETCTDGTRSGTYEARGMTLCSETLHWYRCRNSLSEGTTTLVLSSAQKGWRSKPVTVHVKDGKATPNTILFELRKKGAPSR